MANKKRNSKTVVKITKSKKAEARSSKRLPKVEAVSDLKAVSKVLRIVGVGASAGGLEALRELIGHLKAPFKMSIVVVQHLAPQHRSMLVELIGRETSLAVREVMDGETPIPGVVSITPPNSDVILKDGKLRLVRPMGSVGPKPSINRFFDSLADELGPNAVGVVLSGTGSDGALGIESLKRVGALTFAQLVETARYSGMPLAAIHTGAVDAALSPEGIAQELLLIGSSSYEARTSHRLKEEPGDPYQQVLRQLNQESGVDFSSYKQSTIERRIKRRMAANHCTKMQDYVRLLTLRKTERQALFQDVLISVTEFFRDRSSFDLLGKLLSKEILSIAEKGQAQFRIWVPGCATGQEAYSLAILAEECLRLAEVQSERPRIQVFATDIDEQAMHFARKGLYPVEALRDVPAELVNRYFVKMGSMYQVIKALRERVVFARHNLLIDPPFLRINLISCRNVFIYFNASVQGRIFRNFHYSLNSKGLLFLGRSESAGKTGEFFDPINAQHKIFQRVERKVDPALAFEKHDPESRVLLRERKNGFDEDRGPSLATIQSFAPDCLLVDATFQLKHAFGRAKKYLSIPEGAATHSLLKLVASDLRTEFTSLFQKARKSNKISRGIPRRLGKGARSPLVEVSVIPLQGEGSSLLYCVKFEEIEKTAKVSGSKVSPASHEVKARIEELERELLATREYLQTVIEEQETSNEELQALNEELQSSNEELQSSNEELETANEELQSSNEELTTLNEEINVKSEEVVVLNDQLEQIQNAVDFPLIVLDRNMSLLRFNAAAAKIFQMQDEDIEKNLCYVKNQFNLSQAYSLIEQSVTTGEVCDAQIETGGKAFLVRVIPLKDSQNRLRYCVVTFVDNTDLVKALSEVRRQEEALSLILHHAPTAVSLKGPAGNYLFANRSFCELVGRPWEEICGRTDLDFHSPEESEQLRRNDLEVMTRQKPLEFEESVTWSDGRKMIFLSSKVPIKDVEGRVESVCSFSLDLTTRLQFENELALFKNVISSSREGILIFASKGESFSAIFINNHFEKMSGYSCKEFYGCSIRELLRALAEPGQGRDFIGLKNRIRSADHVSHTLQCRTKEGTTFWAECRFTSLRNEAGALTHVILLVLDVTEARRLDEALRLQQEELSRSARLVTLGEVAAGIAHELNTPLNSIQANVDLLERLTSMGRLDPVQVSECAHEIEKTVTNISKIIIGLRSLARLDTAEALYSYSIGTLVQDALTLCSHRLSQHHIEVRFEIPEPAVVLECRPVQLCQVLVNLINNAIEAISTLSERWVSIQIYSNSNSYGARGRVEVTVTDSGVGIPTDIAEKIMVPFFTTKPVGTGMGLSLCQSIIKQHHGSLVLDQSTGHTSFKISLPIQQPTV